MPVKFPEMSELVFPPSLLLSIALTFSFSPCLFTQKRDTPVIVRLRLESTEEPGLLGGLMGPRLQRQDEWPH